MDSRISFITLAVADVARSRAFYIDRLGWSPLLDADGVVMLPVGPTLVLSLWDAEEFTAEVGYEPALGRAPVTLAHNVPTPAGVDEVLDQVAALGASVQPAVHREWGGYSGYFADPDGYRWEVAYNPSPVGDYVLG